jgi:hypothetical protein
MRAPLLALLAVTLLVVGCGSSGPGEYSVMITEPSGNIAALHDGHLEAHWSCDATVDPATRFQGGQIGKWTDVVGATGVGLLRLQASCPTEALLTVQVDAAAQAVRPTRLRCEVFDADGQRVADESVNRGLGTDDPVCRVIVPK